LIERYVFVAGHLFKDLAASVPEMLNLSVINPPFHFQCVHIMVLGRFLPPATTWRTFFLIPKPTFYT
jgi:hypothetical protein